MPAREQHVVGLDVAVHHAVLVRVIQRLRHLAQEPRGLGQRQLAAPLEPRAERFALDERHRVPEQLARESGIQQGNHVRMLQPRHHLHLAPEAILVDRRGHLGRQHLDDHLAAQRGLLGQEDTTHPAATQLALDSIRSLQRGTAAASRQGRSSSPSRSARQFACEHRPRAAAARRRRPSRGPRTCRSTPAPSSCHPWLRTTRPAGDRSAAKALSRPEGPAVGVVISVSYAPARNPAGASSSNALGDFVEPADLAALVVAERPEGGDRLGRLPARLPAIIALRDHPLGVVAA